MGTYLNNKTCTSVTIDQVLYKPEILPDSYYIISYFSLDIETNTVKVRSEIAKNLYRKEERLMKGTYKECQNYLKDIATKFGIEY